MKAAGTDMEDEAIREQCRPLRLPTIAVQFRRFGRTKRSNRKQTHVRYLGGSVRPELEDREQRAVARRMWEARLPRSRRWRSSTSGRRRRSRPTRSGELAQGGFTLGERNP